jgi:hypothetical protein
MGKRLHAISMVAAVALICLATAPAQAACGTKAITLYSAYSCGICKQVRTLPRADDILAFEMPTIN